MVRIRGTVAAQKRKRRVLKDAKGQFGHRSKHYRQAIKSVIKGLTYEYRDRKVKKREFRRLWIVRINAACREVGISYSRFINGLMKAEVCLDRKVLSELAISSPAAFKKLVKVAQEGKVSALATAKKPAEKESVEKKPAAKKTSK
jgi:large subunit ribosomal protein L20